VPIGHDVVPMGHNLVPPTKECLVKYNLNILNQNLIE